MEIYKATRRKFTGDALLVLGGFFLPACSKEVERPTFTLVTFTISNDIVAPGDRIEGKFTAQYNGLVVLQTNRIGIGVEGPEKGSKAPSYLDFGWKEKVKIAPGELITYEGAVPTAPDVEGDYYAFATWQDLNGEQTWKHLGNKSIKFTIKK